MKYQDDANEIEMNLRTMGFISSDIVGVAYALLKNNIDSAESLHESELKISELMKRAEDLLKEDI